MKTRQSLSRIKKSKLKDLYPICDKNLYLNDDFTKRIGLIDKHKEVTGWVCPECSSEFDLKDNIVYIYGQDYTQGNS